jgi:hypothetical protein
VLNHCVRLGDNRTPAELAAAFQVTRATLTSTLQRLEAKGFIRMARDPRDGRSKRVLLTPCRRGAPSGPRGGGFCASRGRIAPAASDRSARLARSEPRRLIRRFEREGSKAWQRPSQSLDGRRSCLGALLSCPAARLRPADQRAVMRRDPAKGRLGRVRAQIAGEGARAGSVFRFALRASPTPCAEAP